MKKTVLLILMSFIFIGIVSCGVHSVNPEKLSPKKLPNVIATLNAGAFTYKFSDNVDATSLTGKYAQIIPISEPTATGEATATKPYKYTISGYKVENTGTGVPFSHIVYQSTKLSTTGVFSTPTKAIPATSGEVTVNGGAGATTEVRLWALPVVKK